MQPDFTWSLPVEIECLHGFSDIGSKFLPVVGLCDDAFAQGFGNEPSVCLLCDFKNQFRHCVDIVHTFVRLGKGPFCGSLWTLSDLKSCHPSCHPIPKFGTSQDDSGRYEYCV